MDICPCKGCNRRSEVCHGKCCEYADWSKQRRQHLDDKYQKDRLDSFFKEPKKRSRRRIRRSGE